MLYFLVINTTISQNLIQQRNIRLVYPKTSIEAAKKIEKYIDSIPEIKNKFLNSMMIVSFQFGLEKIADAFQKRAEELFRHSKN